MADMQGKKSDTLTRLAELSAAAILLTSQITELVGFATDNGFLSGGANAITDAECVGANAHLDAASFNAGVTALGSVNLSTGNRTTLRKASRTPVPGI